MHYLNIGLFLKYCRLFLICIWIQITNLLEMFCSIIYPKHLGNVCKKNLNKEWCFEFAFLLYVTGCVREKWVYSLRLTKGRLALLKLAQMANWYQRFLQHCLQVARRSVWKYITACFHSKEQLLLPGFIKSCPPNKQYLSSTPSTGSPQEAVPVVAPLRMLFIKKHCLHFLNMIHLKYCKMNGI